MKLRYRILFALPFCILSISLNAQTSPLNEGVRLFREGQFDQALVMLEQAHQLAPQNAMIENLLGLTETKLGHIEKANIHFRNAIRLDPAQPAPHRNLGFNLLMAKDDSAAEPELREASRLNPSDPFAHYYLVLLALATGHDAEAIEQAAHAGNLLENDPDTSANLAEAEIRTGHADAAASRIEQLEQTRNLSLAREYQIAVLASQHAFYSLSVHCFKRIATLNPIWQNRYNLALAQLYAGQASDASTLLATLHNEQPSNADILMFLGSAYEMQEKIPEALEAYRAAAAADPSNPDRILDYTRLLMASDKYDAAIQVVEAGMGKSAATAPLKLRLGAIEMIKGHYEAARNAFNAALAIDPALDVAYVGLAQTYARQSNDAAAIHVLEDARAKRPGRYLLEYYFGMLASRLGREKDAVVALENAAQLDPQAPAPFFQLGKLYVAKQDWPQARTAFERVVALNPQFAPAHYQLSQIYVHLGLHDKAEQEALQTRTLMAQQRDDLLRKQRERAASFAQQTSPGSSQ